MTQSRQLHLVALGIGLLHVLAALITNRFEFGFGSMTFYHLSDGTDFAFTADWSRIDATYPIGYPLVVALFDRIGVHAVLFGKISTVVLAGAIGYAATLLGYVLLGRVLGIFAGLAIALSPHLLRLDGYIWVESFFTASVLVSVLSALAAIYWIDGGKDETAEKDSVSRHLAEIVPKGNRALFALAMLAIAAPFWFRYIGFAVTGACASLVVLHGLFTQRGIVSKFAFAAGVGVLTLPIFIKNLILHHSFTGHALGADPAYTFGGALYEMLFQTGLFSIFHWPGPVVDVGGTGSVIAFTVIVLALSAWAARRSLPIALTLYVTLAYLLAFAYSESTTRLDLINIRFIHPIMPLFAALIFAAAAALLSAFNKIAMKRAMLLFGALVWGVIALGPLTGLAVVVVGSPPSDFAYSPETLRVIKQELADGENILVNRFGEQLAIDADDRFKLHGLPFGDPWNADYTAAYGMRPWTRDEFVRVVQSLDINKLVFFLGRDGRDPFLDADQYGLFMKAIADGTDPLAERVEKLHDGFVVHLRH